MGVFLCLKLLLPYGFAIQRDTSMYLFFSVIGRITQMRHMNDLVNALIEFGKQTRHGMPILGPEK